MSNAFAYFAPSNKEIMITSIKQLTEKERKIYRAVMRAFPATSHESALDIAIQGGVNWQFISK